MRPRKCSENVEQRYNEVYKINSNQLRRQKAWTVHVTQVQGNYGRSTNALKETLIPQQAYCHRAICMPMSECTCNQSYDRQNYVKKMANKKYKTFGRVAEWLKATDCENLTMPCIALVTQLALSPSESPEVVPLLAYL